LKFKTVAPYGDRATAWNRARIASQPASVMFFGLEAHGARAWLTCGGLIEF
jgi:hypothetical protein